MEEAEEEAPAGRRGWRVSAARTLLNLPENFTAAEVGRAFRRAALRAHPDKGGRPEDFLRLSEAYETLLDEVDPSRRFN